MATAKILAIKAGALTRPTCFVLVEQVGLVNATALIANIFTVATRELTFTTRQAVISLVNEMSMA